MAASRFSPPATPLLVGERHLPDDVLQRVLVGLPLEDHRAAASACTSFRDVITGPRFLALRKRYGFAEHSIVIVASVAIDRQVNDSSRIRVAHKSGGTASILDRRVISSKSTTDRGSRLFVSTEQPGATPSQILAVDVSSRRWRPFATRPGISAITAWSGMVDSCMSQAASSGAWAAAIILILSTRSTKLLGYGKICLRCQGSVAMGRRASSATSCSLRAVSIFREVT